MTISFDTLGLPQPIATALVQRGLITLTPLQQQLLPAALAGDDVVGVAPIGSGKTTAALLTGATHLGRTAPPLETVGPRVLFLTPTHESAAQTADSARSLLTQVQAVTEPSEVVYLRDDTLPSNAQVVVADPATVLAHFHRGRLAIGQVQLVVLDDVSRAMTLGFASDLHRLFRGLPRYRQTVAFCPALMSVAEFR